MSEATFIYCATAILVAAVTLQLLERGGVM
jgi:hypothetical protein